MRVDQGLYCAAVTSALLAILGGVLAHSETLGIIGAIGTVAFAVLGKGKAEYDESQANREYQHLVTPEELEKYPALSNAVAAAQLHEVGVAEDEGREPATITWRDVFEGLKRNALAAAQK